MKYLLVGFVFCLVLVAHAGEQVRFRGYNIECDEPVGFDRKKPVKIIVYALPNGNTIPWTKGRLMEPGMDWHFDIQHIDAQTDFVRQFYSGYNIILVYVIADKKSFPVWAKEVPDSPSGARELMDWLNQKYRIFRPSFTLSSHSGGGRFVFDLLKSYRTIPKQIERMAFLDSFYGYEDSLYTKKFVKWIKKGGVLNVTSYRDDLALYNGKPVVSATGGTGYRTKLLAEKLNKYLTLNHAKDSLFDYYTDNRKHVFLYVKTNDERKIYHTTLVYRNGFINALLCGTPFVNKGYEFWSPTIAYKNLIKTMPAFKSGCNESLEDFKSKAIGALTGDSYDSLVYKMFENGCTPRFMDDWKRIDCQLSDTTGSVIHAYYFVKPDYLCVGSDSSYIRVPMQPKTAQRIANRLGAFLSTPKISDDIYKQADIKLTPEPLVEKREAVSTFFYHNGMIEKQRAGRTGLIAGHKKDVVLSNKVLTEGRPDREALYGWHKPDGSPIQPVYAGHVDWYVDYSHGFRLVRRDIWVDGIKKDYLDVLSDKRLAPLLTYELPLNFTAYPTKE